jgi:hypothetical protein
MEFWDSYMYGEFYAALKKIAAMGPEENEWDAVDKYDEVKKMASDVLALYASKPPLKDVPRWAPQNSEGG